MGHGLAETAGGGAHQLAAGQARSVLVHEEVGAARATRAFRDKLTARGEVQQCYGVAGAMDYVLVVIVADLAAYEAFCDACLLYDPNVRSFTTQIVLDRTARTASRACVHGTRHDNKKPRVAGLRVWASKIQCARILLRKSFVRACRFSG
ncbi:MAG: Lrp/AsnC family transcriptional regulator [Variovorax sp.]|nr:MAG: Lrp/AsnC family transcriptional regulator [Variovorax sp.]